MKFTHVLAVAFLALGTAACTKPKQTKPVDAPVAATTETGGASTSAAGEGTTGSQPLTAQQQALAGLKSKHIVYFDYDSSEIPQQYLSVVSANATYLVKYPAARLRLEGNTDDRGSREYNIGLGESRAQTVRRALMAQGVADGQITTVSFGEERPAVAGDDEAAYAQNRRVEFVYAQ
jgi:peptidoglycan-associated lipoprotein